MEVIVNGKAVELGAAATLQDLLLQLGHGERRVAVEVNREIVPRSLHASHALKDGDRIELNEGLGPEDRRQQQEGEPAHGGHHLAARAAFACSAVTGVLSAAKAWRR